MRSESTFSWSLQSCLREIFLRVLWCCVFMCVCVCCDAVYLCVLWRCIFMCVLWSCIFLSMCTEVKLIRATLQVFTAVLVKVTHSWKWRRSDSKYPTFRRIVLSSSSSWKSPEICISYHHFWWGISVLISLFLYSSVYFHSFLSLMLDFLSFFFYPLQFLSLFSVDNGCATSVTSWLLILFSPLYFEWLRRNCKLRSYQYVVLIEDIPFC